MANYKVGDFIRLKDINAYLIDRVRDSAVNIFEISKINQDYVEVLDCEQRIKPSDIEPIPINGKDDLQIYYDPIIAANFIGDAFVAKQVNHSYYLEAFKNCKYRDETFYDLINERNLKYVHEVQSFLREKFQKDELKIDLI